MPQTNFPILVSLDWLEFFGEFQVEPQYLKDAGPFVFEQRKFGSKMWSTIYEISALVEGANAQPFATFCVGLRGKFANPNAASLKIANEQLYRDNFFQRLWSFQLLYKFDIRQLSRVDLAADFLYLKGRVSGYRLVQNLKSLKWWKCGTSSCSEHYSMPYSIKWAKIIDQMEEEVFLNAGELTSRVESLTFGTKASAAQVCIYDKTLELEEQTRRALQVRKRDDLDVTTTLMNGQSDENSTQIPLLETGICPKQYIVDAWKEAKVYDPHRHTWRVEIRLNSKSLTIADPSNETGLRPLYYNDITKPQLWKTFKSAADVWFRLVDATEGGRIEKVTKDTIKKFAAHKCKLPVVDLFPFESLEFGFSRADHVPTPSRFTRGIINKLDSLSNDQARGVLQCESEIDRMVLRRAANVLCSIYKIEKEQERAEHYDKLLMSLDEGLTDAKYRHHPKPGVFWTLDEDEYKVLDQILTYADTLTTDQRENLIMLMRDTNRLNFQ